MLGGSGLEQTRKAVVKTQAVQTPQELFELQMESFRLAAENVSSYWRQWYDILTAHAGGIRTRCRSPICNG